jgi:hypothetical protein
VKLAILLLCAAATGVLLAHAAAYGFLYLLFESFLG